ncbi:MAG: hypothetical protein HUJ68_10825, partial [Clostridia bacterium]|nr:hypothetical protein [Clostridia bacterium]
VVKAISHHNETLDANNQVTDENGEDITVEEAKKLGNAISTEDLAAEALNSN